MNRNAIEKARKELKFIIKKMTDVNVIESGAQLAYYLVIAIISLIAVAVAITSRIPGISRKLTDWLQPLFPENVFDVIIYIMSQIRIPDNNSVLFFAIMSAFWFSSRCIVSIRRGINKIYGLESANNPVKLRLYSFILSLGLAFAFISLLFLVVMGEKIGIVLFTHFNISNLLKPGYTVFRYLIPATIMIFVLSVIYRFGPVGGEKWRNIYPGAIFSSVITTFLSATFSYYVNNMKLSQLLGSMTGIFIFLIWIYWSCIIIFIGAAFNTGMSEISKPYSPKSKKSLT